MHTAGMTVLAITCSRCGNVRVSVRRVTAYPESREIRLDCPVCRGRIVREVPADLLDDIVGYGAMVRRIAGAAFTVDDLLDFHDNFDAEMRELLR